MKDLYHNKLAILREVLDLTQNVEFHGNDNDADKYIDLIAKREDLFDQAKEIDKKLECAEYTLETAEYRRELSVLARQIIEQDNYMNETVLKIRDDAKTDVRNMNNGKNLSTFYTNTLPESVITGHNWSQ